MQASKQAKGNHPPCPAMQIEAATVQHRRDRPKLNGSCRRLQPTALLHPSCKQMPQACIGSCHCQCSNWHSMKSLSPKPVHKFHPLLYPSLVPCVLYVKSVAARQHAVQYRGFGVSYA